LLHLLDDDREFQIPNQEWKSCTPVLNKKMEILNMLWKPHPQSKKFQEGKQNYHETLKDSLIRFWKMSQMLLASSSVSASHANKLPHRA